MCVVLEEGSCRLGRGGLGVAECLHSSHLADSLDKSVHPGLLEKHHFLREGNPWFLSC